MLGRTAPPPFVPRLRSSNPNPNPNPDPDPNPNQVELMREIAILGSEEADLELQTKMSREKAALAL